MNTPDSNPESPSPTTGEPQGGPVVPLEPPVSGGLPDDPSQAKSEPVYVRDLLKKEKDRDREKERERKEPKDPKDPEKADKKDKEKKKEKKKKKEVKKADPWQRYKALHDALKESQDLVDLADHKARFALIIMGALNAAIIILSTRSDLLLSLPANLKLWLYAYFAVYAIIAIYFLVQAIESLRPRSYPDLAVHPAIPDKQESLGLRFFQDALRYETPTYLAAWQSVRVSQLNAELATQLHTLARINKAKYNAVAKLYLGLQAITVLTAGLLVALAVAAWVDHRAAPVEPAASAAAATPQEEVKLKGGKPKKGGWAILGEPERIPVGGVREPSGIVYAPGRKSFFVVGDEGSLVEIDATGRPLATYATGGNLEDVAWHEPSGRLVLLSEKKGELVIFDPVAGRRTGSFRIDSEGLLGQAGIDKNQGFEGLAFQPEEGRPGGGVFHLVHQRAPALLVTIAFDPLAPQGSLGAASVLKRGAVADREDLTAVTYDRALDRLFVLADSKDRIVMLNASGDEEAEIVLPGVQQEGASFDEMGALWIADDRAGVLVFRDARARIAAEMKTPAAQKP